MTQVETSPAASIVADPVATYIFKGTLTAEQPLATASADLIARERTDSSKPSPIPTTMLNDGVHLMFPSTGLRGKLRRAARDVVREAIIKKTGNNHPFSLDEHYLLTLGGIKQSAEQQRSSISHEVKWRKANPLLSVFGSGDAGFLGFLQGRLSVGNAIAKENIDSTPAVVVGSGARTDDFYRDRAQVQYLTEEDVSALIGRADGGRIRSQLQLQIKNKEKEWKKAVRQAKTTQAAEDIEVAAALQKEIDALNEEVKKVKEDTGTTDVSIGRPLPGWKAIPQGTQMDHRMIATNLSLVELGLVIRSIQHMGLRDPRIGGHIANGCGEISASWEVFKVTEEGKKSVGFVKVEPWDLSNIPEGDLSESVRAFDAFMASDAPNFSIPQA